MNEQWKDRVQLRPKYQSILRILLYYLPCSSSTVKIDRADKQKLEKLQAMITIKSQGKKVTQQELLSILISQALEKGDEFAREVFRDTVPMSDEDFAKIKSLSEDWGVRTRWQDIDKTLYGSSRGRNTRS